jgi:hypothetical protein
LGWSDDLDALVQRDVALLLIVRRECLPAVLSRWRLETTAVFDVEEAQPERIAEVLSAAMSGQLATAPLPARPVGREETDPVILAAFRESPGTDGRSG